MKIFAIDCSATPASVALVDESKILGEFYINTKLTHSQTLMPMVDALLKSTVTDINSVDAFALTTGPGSFTGIRIGVAAVKGMTMALNKPCIAVSTLEAMAQNITNINAVICCVMDARCNQVYNANFRCSSSITERLCDDRALSIDELVCELLQYNEKIVLVGDGAELCYKNMKEKLSTIELSPENLRFQRASSVAQCAIKKYNNKEFTASAELMPQYLRLPQAQRELKKKLQEAK